MKEDKNREGKQSFITEARRKQIVEAAITTLDEIGYVKTSLAQIAKRAGISTTLISYHFADKSDLMNHLISRLTEESTSYILERVKQVNTPQEKLETYIIASLAYQGTNSSRSTALIEIVFNARTHDDIPYYKIGDDENQEPTLEELRLILHNGQEKGVFAKHNVDVLAHMIQGAIGEYLYNVNVSKKVALETYGKELVRMINKVVIVDSNGSGRSNREEDQ